MDGRPVLVCTEFEDATADLVIAELNRRRVPVLRFDPGRGFPAPVVLAARIGAGGWDGRLTVGERTADLSAVRSLSVRRSPVADGRGFLLRARALAAGLLGGGDERAALGDDEHGPLVGQHADGFPGGHAGDAELVGEALLARQGAHGWPVAALDAGAQHSGDLHVYRHWPTVDDRVIRPVVAHDSEGTSGRAAPGGRCTPAPTARP